MDTLQGRPMGVTLVALLVILQGVLGIVLGLNLTGTLSFLDVPTGGDASATGAALIIAGIAGLAVGLGLFTLKLWAYAIALVVLGMTVLAGILALIQFGFASENLPSLVPAVISAILFAYMFSERVRPYFDRD